MLVHVIAWLIETWTKIWNFMMDGGVLTLFPILLIVLRKLGKVMSQFTN